MPKKGDWSDRVREEDVLKENREISAQRPHFAIFSRLGIPLQPDSCSLSSLNLYLFRSVAVLGLAQHLARLTSSPLAHHYGRNDPGSDNLLITL